MNGLTAWERWELANFDAESQATAVRGPDAEPATVDRSELDRLRDEARHEGYQAGYAAGQAAARAEAGRLAAAAASLDQAIAEFDQQVADELLALAVEIARQVVREEITGRPDIIVKVVHEALAQLPHQHATIFLHPDDASLVRSYVGDALAHAGHRLLEDARLNPGDCILESGSSQTDATVATRWRRVVETLGVSAAWQDKDGR
ncbi:MAG: flagellar assembly protein FliH [Rhodocyclales bacterium]|nr:flagellar assembly protein FliH [Rhodocyclales bacterium]